MRARPTAQRAGFTLIEVMVAVAILALAFTAIFSSEGGAIKVAQRARQIETAVSLVRCKMGEIDEKLLNEGLPAIEAHDTDGCCEDAERPGFECEWHIDRVVLPDVPVKSDEEAGEDAAAAGAGAGAGAETTGGTKAKSGGTKTEATDTLAEVQKTLSASTAGGAGTDSLDQALAGVDMGGLSDLAFDLAFPIIKPAIEEQVRRVTITVRWHEGRAVHSFDVVRFVVSEQGVPLPDQDDESDQGDQASGGQNSTPGSITATVEATGPTGGK